jgi:hypothetical protein
VDGIVRASYAARLDSLPVFAENEERVMWRNWVSPALAALGNAYAFGIALYMSAWWGPGREEIEEGGPGWLVFYFFPMVFTIWAFAASRIPTTAGTAGLAIATFLLFVFCFATLFTIGPFFVPALITLAVATVAHALLSRPDAR